MLPLRMCQFIIFKNACCIFHIYSNLYFRSCPANIRYRPA
nr:MAG TPA: hypothetical protein [Caudoviricetes sp.]